MLPSTMTYPIAQLLDHLSYPVWLPARCTPFPYIVVYFGCCRALRLRRHIEKDDARRGVDMNDQTLQHKHVLVARQWIFPSRDLSPPHRSFH